MYQVFRNQAPFRMQRGGPKAPKFILVLLLFPRIFSPRLRPKARAKAVTAVLSVVPSEDLLARGGSEVWI